MTAAPSRLDQPARRRRHARLIAALVTLIGACAEAAGAVYGPIADAPPGQEGVEVSLLPCVQVSLSAALLLDRARAEDDARWPAVGTWEQRESDRTFASRCAVAQAQELADPGPLSGEDDVLSAVRQSAAMGLLGAGDDVAALWLHDPAQGAALVLQLAAGGEFAIEEVLDAAVGSAVVTGLLALQETRSAPDPSTAAEACLGAVPYIAAAVAMASADLD